MNQNTSASGGFLAPQWFANGEPPPPEIPRWGERVEDIRMYELDGSPDDYCDLRLGRTEDGRLVLGVAGDGGCGYAFIDVADLKAWAMGS